MATTNAHSSVTTKVQDGGTVVGGGNVGGDGGGQVQLPFASLEGHLLTIGAVETGALLNGQKFFVKVRIRYLAQGSVQDLCAVQL